MKKRPSRPIVEATVIGSWSLPGWYQSFIDHVGKTPAQFGRVDREEAVRDAVLVAIDDQQRAGLDRITDGEVQRVDFNLGFYDFLTGLESLPQDRMLGPPAHDQRGRFRAIGPIEAPKGLGTVDEFRRFRLLTNAAAKWPVPGAYTLSGCIDGGETYRCRDEITEALIPIVNAELKALVAAGVDFVQIDEPSFACHPGAADRFLDVIDRTVTGVDAYISMHLCFGNYRARAVGWRSYTPLFPHIGKVNVDQLALEFASREMAEIDLLKQLPETMDVAVGVVDVKNTWIEPSNLVAHRIDQALRIVGPERLSVTPDCGFSQTARHVATAKAKALVDGARLVRVQLEPDS